MQLVNLKCPNCGGDIEKDGDSLYCKACGAAFAVNYDEADVEHEKLQNYDQISKIEHEHEKEMEEIRFKQNEKSKRAAERRENRRKAGREFRGRIFSLIFILGFFSIGPLTWWFMAKQGLMPSFKEMIEEEMKQSTRDVYDISIDNFTDDVIDNMIAAAKEKKQKSRNDNPVKDYINDEWVEYNLSEVEYDSAYLITGASEGKNRVVVILKLEYTSDAEDKTTYDALYFDNLKLSDNDTIVSDYAPKSIHRSDLAWKSDSYENRDQCYRENVLAFGGTVTEIKK
ncbi:MAG: hypothetical protein J5625_03665 [Lachnospiraceae bacterium]|nr:hypothetical protein [Lachnospiraceae bacterium]